MILQPVSCSNCFAVIPRGPRILPTKLYCKNIHVNILSSFHSGSPDALTSGYSRRGTYSFSVIVTTSPCRDNPSVTRYLMAYEHKRQNKIRRMLKIENWQYIPLSLSDNLRYPSLPLILSRPVHTSGSGRCRSSVAKSHWKSASRTRLISEINIISYLTVYLYHSKQSEIRTHIPANSQWTR